MVQLLYPGDSFEDSYLRDDAGGTDYTQAALWWPAKLWTTDSATGYAIGAGYGVLHNGYVGTGGGRATSAADSWAADQANLYILRRAYGTDLGVRSTFKMVIQTGTEQAGSASFFGVGARIQAGTNTSFTGTREQVDRPDGYYFILANHDSSGSVAKWMLLKYRSDDAGPTVLAETASFAISTLALTTARLLRMTVTNSGEEAVDIVCYSRKSGQAEVELLTYSDSSATALLTPGHCGLVMPAEIVVDGSNTSRIDTFDLTMTEVVDGVDADIVRDEFLRVGLDQSWEVTDHFSTTGESVLGSFTGGRDAATGSIGALRREATLEAERIESDSATPIGGAHISFIVPNNIYEQRHKIRFEMASGIFPGTRYAGIILRADYGASADMDSITDATDKEGYLVVMQYDGTDWDAWLYRYTGGSRIELAHANNVPNLDEDVVYKLDVGIKNVSGPGPHSGNVAITVTLNSAALAFTSSHADCSVSGPVLTDVGVTRIESGPTVGFFAQGSNSDAVYIYEFMDGPVDYATGSSEFGSVTVRQEQDGATGTFTVPSSWPVKETTDGFAGVAHRMDSGHVKRHSADTIERRTWTIRSRAATDAEKDALATFVDDHQGCTIPFTWTTPEPEAETLIVAFADTEFMRYLRAPDVNSFEVHLEERV